MGRIGCFLTGCCYGKETHLPIGILFHHSSVAPNGVALFPTQLLEAGFEGVMACFLVYAFYRKKALSKGLLRNPLYVYLISYAVFRFFLEFFRGDAVRGMLFGLSTSQWISLIVIMICLLFIQKDSSVADKSRSNIR
jgi:phosphatidylglycerol:prolipoprotein diacylglycerol transferase